MAQQGQWGAHLTRKPNPYKVSISALCNFCHSSLSTGVLSHFVEVRELFHQLSQSLPQDELIVTDSWVGLTMSPPRDSLSSPQDATILPIQHVYRFLYSLILLWAGVSLGHVSVIHYGCHCCEFQPSSLCLSWRAVFLQCLSVVATANHLPPSAPLLHPLHSLQLRPCSHSLHP